MWQRSHNDGGAAMQGHPAAVSGSLASRRPPACAAQRGSRRLAYRFCLEADPDLAAGEPTAGLKRDVPRAAVVLALDPGLRREHDVLAARGSVAPPRDSASGATSRVTPLMVRSPRVFHSVPPLCSTPCQARTAPLVCTSVMPSMTAAMVTLLVRLPATPSGLASPFSSRKVLRRCTYFAKRCSRRDET